MGGDAARQRIEAASESCGHAASASGRGAEMARQRVAWTAAMGLDAMGRVLQQAVDGLSEAQQQWGHARSACDRAAAVIASASQATSSDAALGHIATATEQLGQARSAAGAAVDRAETGAARAAHTEIGDATRVIGLAASAGRTAVVTIDVAIQAVEGYRGEVVAAAQISSSATGASSSPDSSPAPARPFKPMRTDLAKRDEIAPYVGLDYAVATLWDSRANKILGPHSADDYGPAATAQWRPPWRDYPRLRRHVEAHAAARMEPGEHMAMYINLPPCKYFDGCDRNLADLIPKGATLHVHWVQSNNMVRVLRFRGTGRALDD